MSLVQTSPALLSALNKLKLSLAFGIPVICLDKINIALITTYHLNKL